jgi:hypothetical protein
MKLGQKSQVITSSLGVKNSKPSLSLGIKQSHNPHLDNIDSLRNYTSDGIINNESNSNDTHYQPIKGVPLSNHKNNINSNRNSIEKAHKMKRSSENNHFT